jgi:uncharacterized membrane protein
MGPVFKRYYGPQCSGLTRGRSPSTRGSGRKGAWLMIVLGIAALVLASVLHCWYAANAGMKSGHAAGAFYMFGRSIVVPAILLLLVSVALIWIGGSFLWAVAALIVYFLVLPLIILSLLQRIYTPAQPGTASRSEREAKDAEWAVVAGLNDSPRDGPVANDFWLQLHLLLDNAFEAGEKSIDVEAGELHRMVGWYPGPNHRMPVCCRVMRGEMQTEDVVLEEPLKGSGASLRVRYQLPRPEKQVN